MARRISNLIVGVLVTGFSVDITTLSAESMFLLLTYMLFKLCLESSLMRWYLVSWLNSVVCLSINVIREFFSKFYKYSTFLSNTKLILKVHW